MMTMLGLPPSRMHKVPMSGCVLYLPLWKRFDASRVWNSIGGKPITVTNATAGKQGYSFVGDGKIDIVDVLTDSLATTTKGTIMLWLKVADSTPVATNMLIAFGDTNADEEIWIALRKTGKIDVTCVDAGVLAHVLLTDDKVINDNIWACVALVQDATSPVVYIDGTLVAITFSTSTDKTKWFSALTGLDNGFIGCRNRASGGDSLFLTGTVDQVLIYERALTAHEVKYLWQATKWRYLGYA